RATGDVPDGARQSVQPPRRAGSLRAQDHPSVPGGAGGQGAARSGLREDGPGRALLRHGGAPRRGRRAVAPGPLREGPAHRPDLPASLEAARYDVDSQGLEKRLEEETAATSESAAGRGAAKSMRLVMGPTRGTARS